MNVVEPPESEPVHRRPTLWLILIITVLIAMSGFFYRNVEQFSRSDRMIRHTHRVIVAITKAVSSLREAEAVQRGYVITGQPTYLQPYAPLVQAVAHNWSELKALTVDNSVQQQRIAKLEPLIAEKLADLDLVIKVRREKDFTAAQSLMMDNYGKDVMDIIRVEVDTMLEEEARLMGQRNEAAERAYFISLLTILVFVITGLALALISARLMRRSQGLRAAAEAARRLHNEQLEQKIAERTVQVRQLASHLESIREDEKRAIARELHDDIGSSMTALSMILEGHFRQNADAPSIAKHADKVRTLLKEITQSTRRIQAGLRPNTLDSLGLIEAIRELASEFSQISSVKTEVVLPDEEAAIPMPLHIPLFRMLQETLNNVAKHARATSVRITLTPMEQVVCMTVQDDGIGMTTERARNQTTHGLLGMRERAAFLDGHAEVVSAPGQGTTIRIVLPCASAVMPLRPAPVSSGETREIASFN